MNDIITSYHQQLSDFILDFNHLLPYEQPSSISRNKRGLINVIGKISKYLFGTATEEDYDNLKTYMENNIKIDQKGNSLLAKQNKDFLLINKLTNKRIDDLYESLNDHRTAINKTFRNIQKQIIAMDHAHLLLQKFITNYDHLISEINKM